MRWWVVLSILTFALAGQAQSGATPRSALTTCLQNARHGNDPQSRDLSAIQCLKKWGHFLSSKNCLSFAKTLEYSNHAEDGRFFCLYELTDAQTLHDCFEISKSFAYGDNADEANWICLKKWNQKMSVKQCVQFAQKMSYPAQEERALSYCQNELRVSPTMSECVSLAQKLNPTYSPQQLKVNCKTKILNNVLPE
jgi:hypothetical protein